MIFGGKFKESPGESAPSPNSEPHPYPSPTLTSCVPRVYLQNSGTAFELKLTLYHYKDIQL